MDEHFERKCKKYYYDERNIISKYCLMEELSRNDLLTRKLNYQDRMKNDPEFREQRLKYYAKKNAERKIKMRKIKKVLSPEELCPLS